MMRKLVYSFAFLMMFNTSIGMAWSKACLHNMQVPQQMSEMDDSQSVMSCHQIENQQSNTQHCKGVCLCAFVAVSPTFYTDADNTFGFGLDVKQSISTGNTLLVSANQMPVERPPKTYS